MTTNTEPQNTAPANTIRKCTCRRRGPLVLANSAAKTSTRARYVRATWLRPLAFTSALATASTASAQDMPWEQAMNKIQQALTGPFAKAVCIILICLCGIGFAASEGGGMLRKAVWGVVGLTIALNAARFVAVFGA